MGIQLPLFDAGELMAKLASAEAGAPVELSPDEAAAVGAFEETALSLQDVQSCDDEWSLPLPGLEVSRGE